VFKAPDLASAIATIAGSQVAPNGLLVDYHLDKGKNGIDAIVELRQRFGTDLPAILITADRSPHVRDAARTHDIQVLSKPLKPAALRALMAQWRVQRVAAAE
jgi:CheY-like chemotaxis protein